MKKIDNEKYELEIIDMLVIVSIAVHTVKFVENCLEIYIDLNKGLIDNGNKKDS